MIKQITERNQRIGFIITISGAFFNRGTESVYGLSRVAPMQEILTENIINLILIILIF